MARQIPVALALLAALFLAGCGGTSGTSTASTGASSTASTGVTASSGGTSASSSETMSSAFPVTVTGSNGELTLASAPEKIVVLSPSLTETLFAIGAGAQVEAVDDLSTYPSDAPTTKLSAYQPNAEAVVGYQPDLVVMNYDANGLVAALAKLKVPTLVLAAPQTLEEAYAQWEILGKATGHLDDATKVVTETQDRIAKAIAAQPASSKGKKIYHELDQTYFSAASSTFIGGIYTKFSLTNIADAAPDVAKSGGYPQLSAEYVVKAAPDLIYLADVKCCQQNADAVAKRPGFAAVPAVSSGAVIEGDDDIASRWGPRIADFAESISVALNKVG